MIPRDQYDSAIVALRESPDSLPHMHQAVLALARAGSLAFARQEYARYGLDKVWHDEDIMALGGRLYKDLYLSSSGVMARDFALESADRYEAAFRATGGYYSGINAATMAWLGGVPNEIANMRAQRVLELLPTQDLSEKTDKYFVEATRAEARLLLGEEIAAQSALQEAWDHDPLNYVAQASTLKQLKMISKKLEQPLSWLSHFTPPQSVHFAGYIFADSIPETDLLDLKKKVTDSIQRQDIGFGYGALAAGSDILIAEALLDQGAELNVVLPGPKDAFIETSVRPYGAHWLDRFETCWEQAASRQELDIGSSQPTDTLTGLASAMSMGMAIRSADRLAVPATQLLICNPDDRVSQTAADAALWKEFGRDQTFIMSPAVQSSTNTPRDPLGDSLKYILVEGRQESAHVESDMVAILNTAHHLRESGHPQIKLGIHTYLKGDPKAQIIAQSLLEAALPGGIYVSDTMANLIALMAHDTHSVSYAGRTQDHYEAYALVAKPKLA